MNTCSICSRPDTATPLLTTDRGWLCPRCLPQLEALLALVPAPEEAPAPAIFLAAYKSTAAVPSFEGNRVLVVAAPDADSARTLALAELDALGPESFHLITVVPLL